MRSPCDAGLLTTTFATRLGTACSAALAAFLIALPGRALAGSGAHLSRFCDAEARLSASEKDTLFRFGAVIKQELEASGARAVLIARSGLDLRRFDHRYSHAGVSLKASRESPWAVRQLYYACDEQLPRIFDQGLSAFLLGTDDASLGYVSLVLLPPEAESQLERTALDNRESLSLLGADYSANAYAFSVRYQNCNQWLAELLAAAWGGTGGGTSPRGEAQRWLRHQGYEPSAMALGWRALQWAGAFVPWIHGDDHPPHDLASLVYRVSMPAAIEGFVLARLPQARRIEVCHDSRRVVVRHGSRPIADGCVPEAGDRVVALD